MSLRTLQAAILTICVLGLSSGCELSHATDPQLVQPSAAKASEQTSPDAAAIKLSTLDYDGVLQLVKSKRGNVVVMDAWSTSCPPCVKEFPKLVALHKKLGSKGVACISLSFDYDGESVSPLKEAQANVLAFLREQGATFDNVISSDDSDELYRKFHLASVPAVFVYDRQGQLRKRFDNVRAKSKSEMFSYEQVEMLVDELLKEPPSPAR